MAPASGTYAYGHLCRMPPQILACAPQLALGLARARTRTRTQARVRRRPPTPWMMDPVPFAVRGPLMWAREGAWTRGRGRAWVRVRAQVWARGRPQAETLLLSIPGCQRKWRRRWLRTCLRCHEMWSCGRRCVQAWVMEGCEAEAASVAAEGQLEVEPWADPEDDETQPSAPTETPRCRSRSRSAGRRLM